jgi:hypothetical protein
MCSLTSPCTPCGAKLRSLRLPPVAEPMSRFTGIPFQTGRLKPLGHPSLSMIVMSYQF